MGLGGLVGVMSGVKSVPPCSMCMVGRFFMMSALMVLSCFAVVMRGVRMVSADCLWCSAASFDMGEFPLFGLPVGYGLVPQERWQRPHQRSAPL